MKEVVITKISVNSSIGRNANEFLEGLKSLRPGIKNDPLFYLEDEYFSPLWAGVKHDFQNELPARWKRFLRSYQLAYLALRDLLRDHEDKNLGLIISGPSTDLTVGENYYESFIKKEDLTKFKYNLANASLSCLSQLLKEEFSLEGPTKTIMSACTSASHSIGMAYDLIRTGKLKTCVAGGAETVSKLTFTGFHALKSVEHEPCRPFDKDREGLTFGEGAGFLLLEEKEAALNRGAEILAEVVGYGAANEGFHDITPHPEGLGYIWAMERSLKVSGLKPEQINYINAHGTGTPQNDIAESIGINKVFNHAPKVSSIKGSIGHCMGASGALESVACVLALKNQFIPGNKNLKNIDPEINLDIPKESLESDLEYVMNNNSGFGGTFTSLIFKRSSL